LRSSAGHVGKVVSYSASEGTMVIRDMNYAGKFIVTERYEDPDNSAIKCYIYGK
jgi:surface antigen